MNDIITWSLAFIAGIAIGAIFFGSLWWTVRKGLASSQPALWFVGSFIGRMIIAVGGLYLVTRGDFARLIVCLLGFLAARVVIIRLIKPPLTKDNKSLKESPHAP